MALTGITQTDPNGVIGGIWLDAVVSERHTMRNRATRHPVESGADVVDHVIIEPDMVVLDCKVTNSPIRVPKSHADGARLVERDIEVPADEVVSVLGLEIDTRLAIGTTSVGLPLPAGKAVVKSVQGASGRVGDVYAELQAIMAERRLVDIRTTLRDYLDMQIEEISAPVESARGGRVLNFEVTAVTIRTAESRLVAAPTPTQQRARPTESAGRQAASDAQDSDVGAESASVLHGVLF